MLVQGAFGKAYGKSMARLFKAQYENEPINYDDPPIIQRRLIPKKYALGFRISREMINDDLYGGRVLKRERS